MVNIDKHKIEDNFSNLDDNLKIKMLKGMYQIRHFEYTTEQFLIRGMISGTCHLYIGQEATAVGTIFALKDNDYISSTHRGHGHCIAKGADLGFMMAELLGKSTGYCKGKGGSMHIANIKDGNLGANGIVGGGIGIATGAAITCKMMQNDKVVVCFFGDGATNRGIFHESVNLASIWDLPIIYLCENNLYGISTQIKRESSDISIVATSFMVQRALKVAGMLSHEQKIECEVIDPRTIQPLDIELIISSVKKTGKLICIEEAPIFGGFMGEVSAQISERVFDWLDAPVTRIAGRNCPMPYSINLEGEMIPSEERIKKGLLSVLNKN